MIEGSVEDIEDLKFMYQDKGLVFRVFV